MKTNSPTKSGGDWQCFVFASSPEDVNSQCEGIGFLIIDHPSFSSITLASLRRCSTVESTRTVHVASSWFDSRRLQFYSPCNITIWEERSCMVLICFSKVNPFFEPYHFLFLSSPLYTPCNLNGRVLEMGFLEQTNWFFINAALLFSFPQTSSLTSF